jgi:predicted DNA-binding transcriptional regulator AlpA
MSIPTFLRFNELKARGIVDSWAQLARLQEANGFPAGRLLGSRIRAWTEEEIASWLENRPTAKQVPPPRRPKEEAPLDASSEAA